MNLTNWIYVQDVSEPAHVKPLPNEECMCREIFCPHTSFLLAFILAGWSGTAEKERLRGGKLFCLGRQG